MIDEFALQLNLPYSVGLYLAANALPDAVLFWDAPACAINKAKYIHGNHDLFSTLLHESSFHRVAATSVTVNTIPFPREKDIAVRIVRIASLPGCGVVLIASLPMAAITGIQYDSVINSLPPDLGKPVIAIPALSLSADWLRGYEETLDALAAALPIDNPSPHPDNVAVVGYLMDRNEEDHTANLRELRRLLRALGLNLVSVWLSGEPVAHLSEIHTAGTIISLPYARRSAQTLAARTGARIVETELPLGIEPTRRWLSQIAEATGRGKKADRLIDGELKNLIPKLEWIVPRFFLNRSFALCEDPVLLPPLAELIHSLGGNVRFAASMAAADHPLAELSTPDGPLAVHRGPTIPHLKKSLAGAFPDSPPDLLVTNTLFKKFADLNDMHFLEFGFPSYFTHALFDSPFLGFRGALNLINRIADRIAFYEA